MVVSKYRVHPLPDTKVPAFADDGQPDIAFGRLLHRSRQSKSLVDVPLAVRFFDMKPYYRSTVLAQVGEKRLGSDDNRNHASKRKSDSFSFVVQAHVNIASELRAATVGAVVLGLLRRHAFLIPLVAVLRFQSGLWETFLRTDSADDMGRRWNSTTRR